MMTVRQFTFYPFVAAGLLVYFLVVHPRALWNNRAGLLWLAGAAAVVYLPMVPQMVLDPTLLNRGRDQVVMFNPDGTIRWEAALWAEQVGRSFGSIIYYSDSAPWAVSSGKSVCMRYGACLFGIGLVYLLLSLRTAATLVVLIWGTIAIFLGSAVLSSPPTVYHFLVAIPALMFISAVALDRFLALADDTALPGRLGAIAVALVLLGVIGATHLEAAWAVVRRPPAREDGQPSYRADVHVLAARFIREHPDYSYYLVRSRTDTTSENALFQFFAADSDLSDVTTALAETLPMPPTPLARGAAFIVLPTRAEEDAVIECVYPSARQEIFHTPEGQRLIIYLVDDAAVRAAYDANSHNARLPAS